MKHINWFILIFFLISMANGCCSYDVKPRVDVLKLNDSTNKNISLNYDIVVTHYSNKDEVIAFIEQGLKELPFKEVIKNQSISDKGYFCQISIKYIGPRDAGAFEFLTGITFGIIPSWNWECDRFIVEYQLFRDHETIKKLSYTTTDKCFNWILVAPLALGNTNREKEVFKNMTWHFFSDLAL